ncbi:hypothetical protein F5Y11DRAFT_308251 [Daldinia sp. FL1419]|nr:hypothetical protein F5Y11DRAFT_308251 [Daldinia sp. FL1419]
MASLRVLVPLLAFIALAMANQNLTACMPECAQSCVESSIAKNSKCTGPDDVKCLCDNIRAIGPGSVSCAQEACGNSTEQLAYSLRSAFTDYCSDNGITVGSDYSGGYPPPGWSTSWGHEWPTTSATGMTSPAADATGSPGSEKQASNTAGGLGGGAIAGIVVGACVACILITGGLLLYAFRLGRGRSKHTQGEEAAGPGPQEEGGSAGAGIEGGLNEIGVALVTDSKVQLDGKPIGELPTEYALSGFHPVKELATHEKPVELSAEPVLRRAADGSPTLPTSWT